MERWLPGRPKTPCEAPPALKPLVPATPEDVQRSWRSLGGPREGSTQPIALPGTGAGAAAAVMPRLLLLALALALNGRYTAVQVRHSCRPR